MKKESRNIPKSEPEISSAAVHSQRLSYWPWWILGIVFLTVLVFAQTLDHSFFTIDDATYVSSNALVQHPSMKILTTPVCQNYHPLTMISLALDATAGENNPAIYHRTNLILHVLNSVLVLFLAYRLLKNSRSAFFVSLLFAIHPLHVESVAWIAERKDLLYTLFYLLAMLTYIQYLEKKKVLWILITGLLFAASLLSKSQAVPFPFILLLLDYWYHRSDWGILALEKIPFFILSLFFGFIALQTQSDAVRDFLAEPVLMKRIVMALAALGLYFVKLLVPYSLSVFYPYPSGMQMQPEFLLALLLLLAALFLLFKYRRDRIIVFGSLFFLISLVPVLQFKSFGAAFMAERYTYLSSVGLFLIMLHVLLRYRPLSGIYGTVLPILLVAVYAWLCWQRTSLWRDERNLLLDADKKYPSVYVKNVLGNWYGQQGQLDSGRYMIAQAMQQQSGLPLLYFSRAHLCGRDINKGMYDIDSAIMLYPEYAVAWMFKGLLYANQAKTDSAFFCLKKGNSFKESADGYLIQAQLFEQTAKADSAVYYYRKAYSLDPAHAMAYEKYMQYEGQNN